MTIISAPDRSATLRILVSFALAAGLLIGLPTSASAAACSFPTPSTLPSVDGNIDDAADLQWLRDNSGQWSGSWTQTANIDLGGCTWSTGIGNWTNRFSGTYDGGGFEISGVDVVVTSSSEVAGLFGFLNGSGVVENVGFTGDVSGYSATGGLVGTFRDTAVIRNSYATGSVTATGNNVGGLVGQLNTSSGVTLSGSYATGPVSGTGDGVGGLVGGLASSAAMTLSNSYATGSVSGGSKVGGLIGTVTGSAVQVTNTFSTGAVTGSTDAGGLIGYTNTPSSGYTASFWDTQTSGQLTSAGGSNVVGATTSQMTNVATFSAWSIASNYDPTYTWGICSAVNSGYPFLTALYASDPCGSDPVAAGASVPTWPVFTFQTPGGGECTAISPQHPRLNSWFTLPDADAPCYVKGSVLTGWSIPGQDWAFAPGRRVWVVDSQTFTSVLEYEWVTIEYDSNIDAKDACLADGVDLPVADRTGITHIPRGVITEQPLWQAPVCSAPGYEFLGWTTDDPHGDPTILPKDGTMPAPAVNSDGDAANTIHLYAMWKWVG